MKTPDEIKKGLECCKSGIPYRSTCAKGCPYKCDCSPSKVCASMMMNDALALIQQLEADKQQLEGMLVHMNQLRDAAAGRALKMEERVHQLEAELSDAKNNHQHTIDIAERQKSQIEKLKKVVVRLNAERDAAVESMRNDPHCCYHCANMTKRGICQSEPRADGRCFEWRGVQKEDGNA